MVPIICVILMICKFCVLSIDIKFKPQDCEKYNRIMHISGLLIGCDEKCKLCDFCRADYAIRKANYAINNVNYAIFF